LDVDDADLAVNEFLGVVDFEQIIAIEVLVDTVDQTAFFADLVNDAVNGSSQLVANSELVSQFGLGLHDMDIAVTDKAGENGSVMLQFKVVPEPSSQALLLLGFLGLAARKGKGDRREKGTGSFCAQHRAPTEGRSGPFRQEFPVPFFRPQL
jgi:hypothetical protein